MILGDVLGVAPEAVTIVRGHRGRPQLDDASTGPDFNVSHTGNFALIALGAGLAPGERIGVDVERADRMVNVERLSRKVLTARERGDDAMLDPDARRRACLRRWTCKEAMSKATGDALSAPFGRLDIDISSCPVLRDGPAPYTPERWKLHVVDAGHDLVATLALWRCE
jgi:4'-phosphopantetheinyl transferase